MTGRWSKSCLSSCTRVSSNYYEKYAIIQSATDTFVDDTVNSYPNSFDSNGVPMYALPFPSSVTKSSFCLEPGEYVIHAVDGAGDGWWGGAHYTVLEDGVLVIHEEMGRRSPSRQSTAFTVALPILATTAFSENKALHGGGGAAFWEDVPPVNIEAYRNKSVSNTAAYGDFAATPARKLSAARGSYGATSGTAMPSEDPITLDLRDGYNDGCLCSLSQHDL